MDRQDDGTPRHLASCKGKTVKKIKPHVSSPKDILDRRGYVERIHEAVLGNAGIATHDVLIYHDEALRAQAKTRAEERLLKEALVCHQRWGVGVAGLKFERAANAVLRERKR